jgi:hypothetical protein
MRTLRSLPDAHVHKCSALGILNGLSHWTDLEKNLYFHKATRWNVYRRIFLFHNLCRGPVCHKIESFFYLEISRSTLAAYKRCLQLQCDHSLGILSIDDWTGPEIIDPVFAKTSQYARFLWSEYERFGLVFTKTGVYKFGHRTSIVQFVYSFLNECIIVHCTYYL